MLKKLFLFFLISNNFLQAELQKLMLRKDLQPKTLSIYAKEIYDLKKNDPEILVRTDTEITPIVRELLNQIDIDKHLVEQNNNKSLWQRLKKRHFLKNYPVPLLRTLGNCVLLTSQRAPNIYKFVKQVADDMQISVPTIFLFNERNFFNAFATSFSTNESAIFIGEKLLNRLSNEEFEAVIAHELGHVRHNHVLKKMVLTPFALFAPFGIVPLLNYLRSQKILDYGEEAELAIKLLSVPVGMLASIIALDGYSRYCEKQADCDALKYTKNEKALVGFFQKMENMYERYKNDYAYLDEEIEKNSNQLNSSDLAEIKKNAWLNKKFQQFFTWFYIKSPFATHPSPESRIQYVQKSA